MGEQLQTPIELYTFYLEISNLFNQRPIGRIPNNPDDGAYLCPNDMLLERATLKYHEVRLRTPEISVSELNSCKQ